MKPYTVKINTASERVIVADDMILTREIPTAAGSKMLSGYVSLLESEALSRLLENGYVLGGKADVGEFAFDLMGESSVNGACVKDGKLSLAAAEILLANEAYAALTMDVNGSVRRAAAQTGLVSLKPTYGTVSRYGTVPVACSGETVSILAASAKACAELFGVVAGHDDKDGTSLAAETIAAATAATDKKARRVAVLRSMTEGLDETAADALNAAIRALEADGAEVSYVDAGAIDAARAAWNILMCAELCNNVSRYDGVKYGYRTEHFTTLDELYTNSRTEAFGELLKTAILFGSETLSTDNYMKIYDKALRTRRVIAEAFAGLFADFDAVLLPAVSTMAYTEQSVKDNKYLVFEENKYTAPASITGLPTVVAGGVQLIGRAFDEQMLLNTAAILEKGGNRA